MPPRLLVISRGPSFDNVVSLWAAPWLTSDERSTATFFGHYADTGEEGSVTVAIDSLAGLPKRSRKEINVGGILVKLDGKPVEEQKIGFYYNTATQTAHILV